MKLSERLIDPKSPERRPRKAAYALPTLFTAGNVFLGFLSIMKSFEGSMLAAQAGHEGAPNPHFILAAQMIGVALVLDGLDGRIARLLDGTSKFGAELDSLSDFISFGVAPALLLYYWCMRPVGGIGWVLTMLLAVCCALRLARFNTMLANTDLPAWTSRFFTGVPAPAGAGLVLMPLIAYNEYGTGLADAPALVGIWMVIVSGLLVSRIPTFSFKRLAITQRWVLPAMVIVTVFVALLASETWNTILACGLLYLASIPFSHRQFQRLSMQRPHAPSVDHRVELDHGQDQGPH